jgi:macrolide-specific efflux system membrane fusion protein
MPKLPKLTRRRAIVAALALGAVAAGVFALGREKAPEYQTAEVTRGDLEVSISASGKVQPKEFVDVGAQVSGQLKSFLIEVGDRVEKGDLLAEIDETLAAAKVEADRAQLKELEASFAQQEATLELAKANADRANMLYKADAISQAQQQAATADLKVATARLAQLSAQIERQQSTLTADLASLSYTKIYAPMSGTVVSQAAVVGQTLNANQTTPTILRIADLSVMTVEADVSEADVLRVKSGAEAYFTTLGSSGERWKSTVRQVLPQPEIVNDVVLYKVLMDVENDEETLKPEMTAQVFFVTGRAENVVLAPVAALRDMRGPGGEGRGEGRRNRDGAARDVASNNGDRGEGGERREREGGSLLAARAAEGRGGRQRMQMSEEFRKAREAHPDAERKLVMVMTNGKPQPRPVLVGLSSRAEAEIVFGLEPGEIVVTGEAVKQPERTAENTPRTQRPPGMGRRGP